MEALACHVLLDTHGARRLRADSNELRLFTKCRNESVRLPAFIEYYRKLGVQRFFVVDNGSSDGSAAYLAAQDDVVVFETEGGFRQARGGTDWLNALLQRFGVGHWCVTVDVDELLVFPGSETVDLPTFTAYLDRRGHDAMGCLLLDCYPGGRLKDARYGAGDDLIAAAPYFDAGPYTTSPHTESPGFLSYGGVRQRVFFPESLPSLRRDLHVKLYHRLLLSLPVTRSSERILARRPHFPPCLTKVPLVRWDERTRYLNVNHFVSQKRVAAERGVLLHFKFLQDFHERAMREAARGEYYDGAIEYRRYCEKLREDPDVTLMGESSTRFEESAQLVRLGLMHDTPTWQAERLSHSPASAR